MRIAVEVLGRKFEQFGVLQRFHLMHQSLRNVHAFAGGEFELFDGLGLGRLLDPDLEAARAQVKRLVFDLVKVQRAALALADFEDLAAVKIAVDDPDFASPSLGHDLHWFSRAVHNLPQLPYNSGPPCSDVRLNTVPGRPAPSIMPEDNKTHTTFRRV